MLKNWKLVYDNDSGSGEGSDNSNDGGGDGGSGAKPSLSELIEKHGLQDELNGMMATNRKKLTQQNQELVDQLKKLRETTKMSSQQREELETRIEQLQEQYMTKEELAKRESTKLQKQHQKEMEDLTADRNKWQTMFAGATIQRSLQDAAIAGEAVRAEQIVSMLSPSTQLAEVLDPTGAGTGEYRPIVKFKDVNNEGEPVTLDLTPNDAIKRMKELPDLYGNLFKGNSSSGIGGTGGGTGQGEAPASLKAILADPEKFREWRKNNPDFDLSKLRA